MITVRPEIKVTFGDKLQGVAKSLGVTVNWLLKDQMRLLFQNLIQITAPSKKVIKVSSGTSDWPSDKKIGEGAVFKDLWKIFWMTKNEEMQGMKRKQKKAMLSDMAAFHSQNRSRSTGRTKRPFGGDAPGGKMFVPQALFMKYAKDKYKNVGKLKASWVKPMMQYQSQVGGRASVPSFVRRHQNTGRVSVTETRAGENIVAITAVNSTNMIRAKIDGNAINAAMRTREKDLAGQVLKRSERIIAQFNANQSPKPATGQAA